MYAWIWRKLPFGLAGKLIGSVLLIAATVALLWYVIFPAADPYLPPYDNDQLGSHHGGTGDPYQPPYSTDHNNPGPTRTAKR